MNRTMDIAERARNHELQQYLDEQERLDRLDDARESLVKDKTFEVLNDEKAFDTLDQNFEVIEKGQVMRALRHLDDAIRKFNRLHTSICEQAVTDMDRRAAISARIDIDALFAALSQIQKNMRKAIEFEAAQELPET